MLQVSSPRTFSTTSSECTVVKSPGLKELEPRARRSGSSPKRSTFAPRSTCSSRARGRTTVRRRPDRPPRSDGGYVRIVYYLALSSRCPRRTALSMPRCQVMGNSRTSWSYETAQLCMPHGRHLCPRALGPKQLGHLVDLDQSLELHQEHPCRIARPTGQKK
jgi:hypothetical protein